MFTDSAESAESDVEVDFDSGADGSLVANGSPDGEGGDSVGVFCESNAIGPRALGLSGSFTGGSGFLSRVVGSAFGSGAGVAVVSGWADAIFASLSLRVTASATSGSADGESTWGATGSASADAAKPSRRPADQAAAGRRHLRAPMAWCPASGQRRVPPTRRRYRWEST